MPKGRVSEVVGERNRLGEVRVKAQRVACPPRQLLNHQRVGHPAAMVVAISRGQYLCLVLESAERGAVDDSVAVPLERGPHRVLGLGDAASRRTSAMGCDPGQISVLTLLERCSLKPFNGRGSHDC